MLFPSRRDAMHCVSQKITFQKIVIAIFSAFVETQRIASLQKQKSSPYKGGRFRFLTEKFTISDLYF